MAARLVDDQELAPSKMNIAAKCVQVEQQRRLKPVVDGLTDQGSLRPPLMPVLDR